MGAVFHLSSLQRISRTENTADGDQSVRDVVASE